MPLKHEKIMVTLDGSTFAAQAMPHALALVEMHDAELILLRVVPPATPLRNFTQDGTLLHSEEHQAQWLDEANEALTMLAQELTLQKYKVTPVVEVGLAAETIIDYAQAHQVSLIVMSTHGRTGLSRWVYGSVADKLLRAAPCPGFLIRASL